MNRLKLYANCDCGILLNFCIFLSNAAWRCATLAAFCVCCVLTNELGGLGFWVFGCVALWGVQIILCSFQCFVWQLCPQYLALPQRLHFLRVSHWVPQKLHFLSLSSSVALAALCVCCGLTADEIGGLGLWGFGCVKQALFYRPRKFRWTKTWGM